MPYYHKLGEIPRKRHVQFRKPDGSLYYEEVFGQEGFSGIQSILYHTHIPSAARQYRSLHPVPTEPESDGRTLHYRHFRTGRLSGGDDPIHGRIPLLFNEDLRICIAKPEKSMSYFYRNADGDEMIFVHQGSGVLESVFGELPFRPGDYLIIPIGTTYRMVLEEGTHVQLVVEAAGPIVPPKRYLNRYGQFIEDSPYCERDIRVPERLITKDEKGEFELHVRQNGQYLAVTLPHHPFDVVGWDGCVYPWALNIDDFEPRTGRIHLPPPVHQTFEGPNFVVCSFVPRLYDYHPEAIPAPYYHSNIDSDEIIYYVHGDFMSRKGIEIGSITVHPRGLPHGPQPGKMEESIGKKETNELAVMIDTFRPLRVAKAAVSCEDTAYPYSWLQE